MLESRIDIPADVVTLGLLQSSLIFWSTSGALYIRFATKESMEELEGLCSTLGVEVAKWRFSDGRIHVVFPFVHVRSLVFGRV